MTQDDAEALKRKEDLKLRESAVASGLERQETLSPLLKLINEDVPSPMKEHTRVISQFLETYKVRA